MTPAELHSAYERALARALRSSDPVVELRSAAARTDCSAALRRLLLKACTHEAGLRMSALLCARLRFERLLQGSAHAAQLFATDPARFAAEFRRYHHAVAPTARGPRAEAQLFEAWFALA